MEMLIKQFKTLNSQNELTSLLLISTLSIIIWFTGPLIAIANTIPLAQPEKRFYIIALFFIGWFFKIYYFSPEPRQIPFIVPNLELVKKIQALEEKFGGFVDFLKKTIINKQGTPVSLINLPWYLVLGPSGSGKTSLLANANVNFLLSKKFKNENLKTLLPSFISIQSRKKSRTPYRFSPSQRLAILCGAAFLTS
jgi:type VI secretion system protein ImpL